MRNLFLFVLCLFFVQSFAQQSDKEEDAIILNMCEYLNENASKVDSIRIEEANEQFLYPYLRLQEEAKIDGIIDGIFYRYQKLCPEFMAILDKENPLSNEEGFYVDAPEKSILSNDELKDFKKIKRFYYQFLEDITEVEIANGFWIERFSDGTYSKTQMDWISETSFKLTFLESDNSMKASFSRKGEEYFYDVLKKEGDFYIIQSLQSIGSYLQFKLYIK